MRPTLRILLSAYACEPEKGSEPGVGWNWAKSLCDLNYDVHVLTRSNNRSNIEFHLKNNFCPENLKFHYCDVPKWLSWYKRGHRGIRIYYLFWQLFAFFKAKELHRKIAFNLIHHITFVGIRQPSFMGYLGVPFIFGPLGGGESAPYEIISKLTCKDFAKEVLRNFANKFVKFDPLMHLSFRKSAVIVCTSNQTKKLLSRSYLKKAIVHLAIGTTTFPIPKKERQSDMFKVLFVGRFLYWKGIDMSLKSFALAFKNTPNASFTLVGKGEYKEKLVALANELGISQQLHWLEWVSQKELKDIYQNHDVFLYPSLHDSGGMVVLEAMAYHIPVICLNIGGPGVIVNQEIGLAIDVSGKSYFTITKEISNKLTELKNDSAYYARASKQSYARAMEMSWKESAKNLYDKINVREL